MAAVLCGGALWYLAPGAEANCKAPLALSETKQKCTFPAPNSIEFGTGKVHFGTGKVQFGTGKEPKTTHEKVDKHFPLF